jgi:23S rRNA (cytosine1962-C5)-methyltransferase
MHVVVYREDPCCTDATKANENRITAVCRFEAPNAFDLLKQWVKGGRKYDVVILDPPAFRKSRATIQKAITGYKEINLRG